MLEKYERIQQLKLWGYNTPKIMKIEYNKRIDENFIKKLKLFAGDAKKMTIRTYSPRDELREFKTPFFPEIPTEEAIEKIKTLTSKYIVLFQEAIDVNTTILTGNIALRKDGSGFYEILKGKYRVRDVDNPPPGAKRIVKVFSSIKEIEDSNMRDIIFTIKDIPFLTPYEKGYEKGVIIEFDLHSEGVGEKKENLVLWEYRPLF